MKNVILCTVFMALAGLVHSQDAKLTKREKKEMAAKENMERTKALVNSKAFTFTGNFMFPQSGQRISMATPPNTLKINKNTVTSNLPFIGTKQAIGANSGMVFEGELEEFTMAYVKKKNKIRLSFIHKEGTERFRFELDVAPDGYTNMVVSSNKRSTISYTGTITGLNE